MAGADVVYEFARWTLRDELEPVVAVLPGRVVYITPGAGEADDWERAWAFVDLAEVEDDLERPEEPPLKRLRK
jgi:hypothetical protein